MTAPQIRTCILLILLAAASVQDLRYRQVFVPAAASGAAAGIVITAVCGDMTYLSAAAGILSGTGVILFSRLTGGAVGSGDGWIIAACGSLMGFADGMALLLTASLLMMPVSALLLLTRRKKKTDTLPFVPFLMAAYLLYLASGGMT